MSYHIFQASGTCPGEAIGKLELEISCAMADWKLDGVDASFCGGVSVTLVDPGATGCAGDTYWYALQAVCFGPDDD